MTPRTASVTPYVGRGREKPRSGLRLSNLVVLSHDKSPRHRQKQPRIGTANRGVLDGFAWLYQYQISHVLACGVLRATKGLAISHVGLSTTTFGVLEISHAIRGLAGFSYSPLVSKGRTTIVHRTKNYKEPPQRSTLLPLRAHQVSILTKLRSQHTLHAKCVHLGVFALIIEEVLFGRACYPCI